MQYNTLEAWEYNILIVPLALAVTYTRIRQYVPCNVTEATRSKGLMCHGVIHRLYIWLFISIILQEDTIDHGKTGTSSWKLYSTVLYQ